MWDSSHMRGMLHAMVMHITTLYLKKKWEKYKCKKLLEIN